MDKKKVRYLNVDSNNRVTTIQKFINNEFGIQAASIHYKMVKLLRLLRERMIRLTN